MISLLSIQNRFPVCVYRFLPKNLLIHVPTRIMQIALAKGLPTTGEKAKCRNNPLITICYMIRRGSGEAVEMIA